ncbi:hypothetical protein J4474_01485 [Candidatus Pacearchaeota archaeon]|nr:hypothetical protein [Candidatus Pacearchaeota archaeon]
MTTQTNTQNERKLELLVVDDNPQYLQVAKLVLERQSDLEVLYATNYQEASSILNKSRSIDGILTDLFFPDGEKDRELYTKSILMGAAEELGVNSNKQSRCANKPIPTLSELDEDPNGLRILDIAINKKIPYILLSQGDRHEGNLSTIRYLIEEDIPQQMYSTRKSYSGEELKHVIGNLGITIEGVDKSKPETWERALDGIKKLNEEKK